LENIYIISDVHGCYKTLLALIDKLPNKKDSKIVFVGDLVDRGANSYDVIKFVMDYNYDCVLGNHEKMFLEYSPMLENDRQNEDLKYWLFKCAGEQRAC
jgi:serine/threonine protein phosphatase 1